MQPEHKGTLALMIAGQIAGKERKQGDARHQYGRHQADEKIAGAEVFQEDLQEGGFDEDRKAEAPEELHQGNGGCISFEQLIAILVHEAGRSCWVLNGSTFLFPL